MPPARIARRAVTNENDENARTRVTRAKAAALGAPSEGKLGAQKPLQAKKNASNATISKENAPQAKRKVLGDVSNGNKNEVVEPETKKPATSITSAAKAAKPTGIQKPSRANSSRSALGPRDKNGVNELKRPASGNGLGGNAAKKRSLSSSRRSVKEETPLDNEENIEPSNAAVEVQVTKTVKVITKSPDGTAVEKEIQRDEKVFKSNPEQQEQLRIQEQIDLMDADDEGDPLMVSEYVYEILDYMKELELRTMPNPNYMEHQKDLEWRMRGVLVDWLLEVHARFGLLAETFYLTVNIIDRFLSMKYVQLDHLQLVGVSAMFIASKYEEVLSPHIGNFRSVTDDAFSEAEILKAERYILATLNYDLSLPNPMHFLRRISKADNFDVQTRMLAKYLLEITLLDHRFLEHRPSKTAAASMHLSRLILNKGPWDSYLEHYSGYAEDDIEPIVDKMIDYLSEPIQHNAFYRKYAGKKFLKASLHARAWAKRYRSEQPESKTQ